MDLKESTDAGIEDVEGRPKVTLEEERNHLRTTDYSTISKEEKDFYKLMFGNDIASVRHRKIHCTACDAHIGSAPSQFSNMFAHPILLTLLCANCRTFYGDGNFEQGEDATDMFCRWCANGGNLYCCSYCSNTFCQKCIKRNFDPLVRKKIEDEEKWKCFVCDPTDLYTARAVCWALAQHVQTVTRILQNDKNITKEDFEMKMNLDEAKCCSRRRSKAKRRKLSGNLSDNEEDETYHPSFEGSPSSTRRKISRRSWRTSSVSNGDEERSMPNTRSLIKPKIEVESFNDNDIDEDDLLPPMIPCVQSMVEGESSETLETLNSQRKLPPPPPPHLSINPIPTANLLKVTPPRSLFTHFKVTPGKLKSKQTLQPILPAPTAKFIMMKNAITQKANQARNLRNVEYSSVPLNAPNRPPKLVAIPNKNTKSTPPRVHTIEYSSLPLRAPSIQSSGMKPGLPPRILAHKPKPAPTPVKEVRKEVRVIEIESDSDDMEVEELSGNNEGEKGGGGGGGDNSTSSNSRNILKNMLSTNLEENSKCSDPFDMKRKNEESNKVEDEIDLRTEEVRMLFKMVGTRLRKVPLLHFPNHNNLKSTRVKTRRFHLAMTKAISALSDINDKVIHTYSNWRKSMLEETKQTHCNHNDTSGNGETIKDITDDIPLDMICTNSESESENNDAYDSDGMIIADKVKSVKSFQERDTVDVGCGEPINTADKSVQAFDVVERDYEKCIGHSVLTKVEYDPVDGSEILKPVIVPDEYNGKYEEQFIYYLQYREENQVQTDDDKGLPDPNETPLKDLIEANSPFVLEMLESIDSPLATGITNELGVEAGDESGSGKENEDQSEPTNVVRELAKMVTELSEELKTSQDSETCLSKKHSEHGKKDRRKQILECNESAEVDMAVQTLIEEDERSRSSSNDDDIVSRHIKQIAIEGKRAVDTYSEDECTIIE